MGTFVTATSADVTALLPDGEKSAAPGVSRRAGWTTDNTLQAAEVNAIANALLDVRTAVRAREVNVKHQGARGDGTTNDAAAFTAANTAASTTDEIYVPAGTYKISTNTTLTAPIRFAPGAVLSVDTGITLNINGPMAGVDTSSLSGSGTYNVTGSTQVRSGTNNLVANWPTNTIASDVNGSTIAGGGGLAGANPNKIGSTAGTVASVATIGGGYDNINNHLAGTIAGGAHHYLNTANGADHGTIGGGATNTISGGTGAAGTGSYCTICGGAQNTINGTGASATITGGLQNTASADLAVVAGGGQNTASGSSAFVAGGDHNTASASGTATFGGRYNTASAQYATARGLEATASLAHTHALSAGKIATAGDRQTWEAQLWKQTTSATPAAMSIAGFQLLTVPNNTTQAFTLLVLARCASTGESAGYEYKGVLKRGASAATNIAVGSFTKTVLGEDVAGWDVNVTADASLGDLRVSVTGEAAKTIEWTGYIRVLSLTA